MNTVFFDLDGTLLPMDLDAFIQDYFASIAHYFAGSEYDAKLLTKGIMAGVQAMSHNDGKQTNDIVFWNCFTNLTGIEKQSVEAVFTKFYEEEFPKLSKGVSQNNYMKKAVHLLKEKGYRLFLTTNPVFPRRAVEHRLAWAGLEVSDFVALTSYENSHYTKPNIAYYEDFMKQQNVCACECLMVGNNTLDDGVVQTIGMSFYLVDDHLINPGDGVIESDYRSDSAGFYAFVENLKNVQ